MKRFLSALAEGSLALFAWPQVHRADPCLTPLPNVPVAEALAADWAAVKRDTGVALLDTAPRHASPEPELLPA